MLIAPAGEWRQLAEHIEHGKVKSKAEFLSTPMARERIAQFVRARCLGRIDTTQVGIDASSFANREEAAWNGGEERSLLGETKKLELTGFREAGTVWINQRWQPKPTDFDTLQPLRELQKKLGEDQQYLRDCFLRVCYALNPDDQTGCTGGGIENYIGDEETLTELADAYRLAEDLEAIGQRIYERACERGL